MYVDQLKEDTGLQSTEIVRFASPAFMEWHTMGQIPESWQ